MMSFTMDFSQGTEILLKLLKLELANRLLPCFCEVMNSLLLYLKFYNHIKMYIIIIENLNK